MSEFILYSYFRSSAAFRVRAALEYKKIKYEYRPIHLLTDGGQQLKGDYVALNPMGEVPCLVHQAPGSSLPFVLGQSMAILEYLDQITVSGPPLFPHDARARARVVQLCENINSGIHPIQNLKVLRKLEESFGATAEQKQQWAHYWINQGFTGVEQTLAGVAGSCSFGDAISAADFFLLGQTQNARRFNVDLSPFPTLARLERHLMTLDFIIKALPEQQPDWPQT